jgi:hypothetical protein
LLAVRDRVDADRVHRRSESATSSATTPPFLRDTTPAFVTSLEEHCELRHDDS